jgi:hypothetical protein
MTIPTANMRQGPASRSHLSRASKSRGAAEKPKEIEMPIKALASPRRSSNHSITIFREARLSIPCPEKRSRKNPRVITTNAGTPPPKVAATPGTAVSPKSTSERISADPVATTRPPKKS